MEVCFLASGETLTRLDANDFEGRTAKDVKRALEAQVGVTRFRQRLFLDNGAREVADDETFDAAPVGLQLVVLEFCSPDEEEDKEMMFKARENNVLALEQLLQSPRNPNVEYGNGMTLLHCAAVHGHVEPVRLLLEAGAEKDATTRSGMMPLHFAAHSNHLDVVRCLIESGAKKDELTRATGSSPLHVASVEGNLQIVRCLVEFKAKIDQPTLSDGSTPLCLASDQGHLKIVRFLLRAGANKDGLRSDGSSPLHLASEQNHLEVVQCLLRAGANKDQLTTDEGYTALHLAAFRGHIDIVRLLVESRANCLLTGHDGRTALKVASDRRRRKIVVFLRSVPEFQTTPASRKARRVGSKENK